MKIESGSGHQKIIPVEVRHLTMSERLTRSAKKGGMFFGLAVASVFIPVMHFFLVPLFLILSAYFGFKSFKDTKSVDLTAITCPVCSKDLKESEMFFNDEFVRLYCYQCQTQLKVS